ncbi:hypothetical protein G6M89_20865 [Natronolimnobius sp. AArcel1]|uniref:hypothetical protein n=1 Tax=Natronolimnobius sp. AArcel1 TaxID=1679093 RepID=UPI0013EACA87|nr:hypothetical protein [Natronolimnobius sp. AArcel1]NGM71414.1 hypothetical protein [Natronolimnobius sp. AArcel1]
MSDTHSSPLQTIPANTRIKLTWGTPTGPTTKTGTVTDSTPKRIRTNDRTLQITNTAGTIVWETTPTETIELGPLRSLEITTTEPLYLTDEGTTVPSYFVGYEGFLTIVDSRDRIDARIPDGLQEYDDRVLTGFGPLPPTYDETEVEITSWGGPTRIFEIIDERTPPAQSPTKDSPETNRP